MMEAAGIGPAFLACKRRCFDQLNYAPIKLSDRARIKRASCPKVELLYSFELPVVVAPWRCSALGQIPESLLLGICAFGIFFQVSFVSHVGHTREQFIVKFAVSGACLAGQM